MHVSVIVPALNGARWMRDQLAALSAQTYGGDWELIVADNGSTDDTRLVATSYADHFPRLHLLDASGVRGQSFARNQAARAASGEVLLFTDVDDIVSPDWVASLADGLARAPVVTGPVTHFVDGEPLAERGAHGRERRARVGTIDPPIGCNMGIRRELFLQLGGFDETITLGWEDIDLGVRAALRGCPTAWVDDAVVFHRRPASARAMWRKEVAYGRGWTMFERRYPQALPAGWVRPLARRAGWVLVRLPYVAIPTRRRAWMARAGGVAGRLAERLRPSRA